MEKINFDNKKEDLVDDFTFQALAFLKGKMSPTEAGDFANEFLDDGKKLKELQEIKDVLDKTIKAGDEYKKDKIVHNLLKDIYGINLEVDKE